MPWSVADDYTLVTEEPIEQTRFAGVGCAINDHANAFAQNSALIARWRAASEISSPMESSRARNFSPSSGSMPFFRKINGSFEVGEKIDKGVADRLDFFTELTLELFGGGAQCKIGACANQIDDRLGLSEIHLAVQKRALGKFARSRAACARAQTCFQNFSASPMFRHDN